ncbi:MAG: FAD-dependent oxidoreductase [Deltaproteobacteria bacterium]|nr:FAD-dependent oxidoreductase [Deltaproteobacteria bacterium]
MKSKTKKSSLPPMSLSLKGTGDIRTGTWRYLTPLYRSRLAPCREACPAGEDIAGVMVLASEENYPAAWERIISENPLPRVCGRVCFHPCEGACNRREFDQAISINALECFLGDRQASAGKGFRPPRGKRKGQVAVVGSGPAGLSCAYHLAGLGFSVTLFEAQPRLGGMLRYGIPAYRLPRDVLDQEIEAILDLGVEARTGTRLGVDLSLDDLKAYRAVFLSTGAWKSLPLNLPGEAAEGVISGLEFLRRVSAGEKVSLGSKVAVIGGGNTAIDAARSALRLGAKPLILYRRTREEMPAWEEEVAEAEEEQIEILFLTSPVSIQAEKGKVKGLECVRNLLGPPGPDGRPEPRPVAGSNFTLAVDGMISAIGEAPDLSFLPAGPKSAPFTIDETGRTSLPGVFAGGDMASRQRTVALAIGAGKRAAMAIDAWLRGEDPAEALRSARIGGREGLSMARYRGRENSGSPEVVRFSDLTPAYFRPQPRAVRGKLPPDRRAADFSEINAGISPPAALIEARRCFNCGTCNLCHNCFLFCPDLAVSARPDRGGYEINLKYCKGCGICVEECPRGAMALEGGK